jgi:glycine hydroxymethyltransferase
LKPAVTSGIRLGSPACTTRGFGIEEFQLIADLIADTIEGLGDSTELDEKLVARQRKSVRDLCFRFPIY